MGKRNVRVDAYIAKSADFAKPILAHLRQLIHQACPDTEETIKWGMPAFEYKGPFCGMAAFKQHAIFGIWKAKLLKDPKNYLLDRFSEGGKAMGNFGKLTSLHDLPPDNVIIDLIQQAKKLNDDGIKLPPRPQKEKKELIIPEYLMNEVKKNKEALTTFNNFSYSHKKEYIEWLTEAKTEKTRASRLAAAIEWMAEGKPRNWKYMR